MAEAREQCQWCDNPAKWNHEGLKLCESCMAEFLGLPSGQSVAGDELEVEKQRAKDALRR